MLTRQSTVSSYCGKFDGESIGILSVKKNVNVPKRCALLTENNKEFLEELAAISDLTRVPFSECQKML